MNEELKVKIEEAIKDEEADIKKYEEMAELASNNFEEKIAGVLCDIRCEEKTHKMLLEHMI